LTMTGGDCAGICGQAGGLVLTVSPGGVRS
jgi:hypothetical protein